MDIDERRKWAVKGVDEAVRAAVGWAYGKGQKKVYKPNTHGAF